MKIKVYTEGSRSAFTLIELLVVIAIIGILAAIVVTSVSIARMRAKDSRIKHDFSQIRPAAELYYNDHALSYANICNDFNNAATDLGILQTDIAKNGGSMTVICSDNSAAYAVGTVLNDQVTKLCADLSGAIKEGSDPLAGVCSP